MLSSLSPELTSWCITVSWNVTFTVEEQAKFGLNPDDIRNFWDVLCWLGTILYDLLVIEYVIYFVQVPLHDLSGMVRELYVVKLRRVVCDFECTYVDVTREAAHRASARPGLFAANVNKGPNWLLVCDGKCKGSAT